MKHLKILLDAAHGTNIPGKCSPDGTHKEYLWSRRIIDNIYPLLTTNGYEVVKLITEDIDPKDHLKRIDINTTQPRTLLISFHNNAAGNGGKWLNARGYEIWTSRGKTNSDTFADIIYAVFDKYFPTIKSRIDMTDGDKDKEEGFNVLVRKPMAVLIEWLFQDNHEDVALLQDDETNKQFCNAVVEAINRFNDTYNNIR
jgi:N-acetylmuramoyl-L-alanine amidase